LLPGHAHLRPRGHRSSGPFAHTPILPPSSPPARCRAHPTIPPRPPTGDVSWATFCCTAAHLPPQLPRAARGGLRPDLLWFGPGTADSAVVSLLQQPPFPLGFGWVSLGVRVWSGFVFAAVLWRCFVGLLECALLAGKGGPGGHPSSRSRSLHTGGGGGTSSAPSPQCPQQ